MLLQASRNVHKHFHLCNTSTAFISMPPSPLPPPPARSLTHSHTHTRTHTVSHTSKRLVGVPSVEDIALIRDWSLRGVSPFNDHPTNQSSFSISLFFFFLSLFIGCSTKSNHTPDENTLVLLSLPPISVLLHNFKVLENQDIFLKVQLGYFCSSCCNVPQKFI